MTTDFTLVADLQEVQAYRLECRTCGTSVSVEPSRWKNQAERCPNCDAATSRATKAGKARAASQTPEQCQEQARHAANARWGKGAADRLGR